MRLSSVLYCTPSIPSQPAKGPPPPATPHGYLGPALLPPGPGLTCPRIYANALSDQCSHRPGSSTCTQGPLWPSPLLAALLSCPHGR